MSARAASSCRASHAVSRCRACANAMALTIASPMTATATAAAVPDRRAPTAASDDGGQPQRDHARSRPQSRRAQSLLQT